MNDRRSALARQAAKTTQIRGAPAGNPRLNPAGLCTVDCATCSLQRETIAVETAFAEANSDVAAMIAASSTTFGLPVRCSSSQPAMPALGNRPRDLITVGRGRPEQSAPGSRTPTSRSPHH